MQSYWDITSDEYFDYIKQYIVGIGPWKDTVVPVTNNYLQFPTALVARAHAHNLQVYFFSKLEYLFLNIVQSTTQIFVPLLQHFTFLMNVGPFPSVHSSDRTEVLGLFFGRH